MQVWAFFFRVIKSVNRTVSFFFSHSNIMFALCSTVEENTQIYVHVCTCEWHKCTVSCKTVHGIIVKITSSSSIYHLNSSLWHHFWWTHQRQLHHRDERLTNISFWVCSEWPTFVITLAFWQWIGLHQGLFAPHTKFDHLHQERRVALFTLLLRKPVTRKAA